MMGNPWLIRQASALIERGEIVPDLGWAEHLDLVRRLVDYVVEHHGEARGVKLARKYVSWAVRGCQDASRMRDSVQFLNTSEDLESFWEALRELGIAADTPVAIAS
jgi:tRNA-dihydrouridine synthase B